MKKPDETKSAIPCCEVDEVTCRECRYFGQAFCTNIALKDAMAKIEQLNETISLMKIQMRGDCGCCKHGKARNMILCNQCLTGTEYHPLWEYEGLPEVERHEKPV